MSGSRTPCETPVCWSPNQLVDCGRCASCRLRGSQAGVWKHVVEPSWSDGRWIVWTAWVTFSGLVTHSHIKAMTTTPEAAEAARRLLDT
jgi:hypothetical protein